MALTPGTRLGVYEVTAQIGEGGMGQAYRATDTTLSRQVAIKILPDAFAADPDRLARFEREAKTLASLNHPHIAAIYAIETSTGQHALVMELVEGEDLSQRIARGAIPIDEALPIARQIAEALEAAHEQGIIHRDLEPANIKVRSDGTVKVLDFGLAKAMEPAVGSSPSVSMSPTITSPAMMTGVGMILGTAAYMSPEQARGKTVDKRTDIWAFGCVLYEMLTGKRAFGGEDVTEVLAFLITKEPDWNALPPATPTAIRTLLKRCLEKKSRERVADISTALFVLTEQASLAAPVGTASAAPLPRRLLWRRVVTPVAAALVASAVVGGTVWLGTRPVPPRVARRLTFDGALDSHPAWTPDGRRLVFSSERAGARNLYWQAADGTGAVERLTESPNTQSGAAVSPDGTRVIFYETAPKTGADVMQLQLDGTRRVTPLVQTPFTEQNGIISPDGRWLAYEANDSGRYEVYVRPFPEVNRGLWQVSTGGGTRPLWARNGQELFYASPTGAIMRVGVERAQSWAATTPTMLIKEGYLTVPGGNPGRSYDISPDGQRFLLLKAGDGSSQAATPTNLIVVQHFDEELKRLVPVN